MTFLSREEVIASLEHRVAAIETTRMGLAYREGGLRESATTPAHGIEVMRLGVARLSGELIWAKELLDRLRAGDYMFAREETCPAP